MREQAREQLEQLKIILRRFYLLALAMISKIERKIKNALIQNMLIFAKFTEAMVN